MKNEIQLVIEELQKEVNLLEKEMNDCIERMDFEEAEHLKNAWFYTKNKLLRVQQLGKPKFRKITRLEKKIQKLKETLEKENLPDLIRKSIQQQLPIFEKELEHLKSLSSSQYIDSDEVINHLEKLEKDELDFFQIEFEKIDFILFFEKKEEKFEIRIWSTNYKNSRYNYELRKLQNMGFRIEEDTAIFQIPNFDKSKIPNVIVILSRIFFEIFHLYKEIGMANIKFTKT